MNTFRVVVLTLAVVTAVVLVVGIGGCEKPNDLPRRKDEVLATARSYQQRFDELARRADALRQRGNAVAGDAVHEAAGAFRRATGTIEEYRRNLQQVPSKADAASGDPAQLANLLDSMRERFEHGVIEATDELAAVESAIALAEQRPAAPRIPATPIEPASDAGSAAPIR